MRKNANARNLNHAHHTAALCRRDASVRSLHGPHKLFSRELSAAQIEDGDHRGAVSEHDLGIHEIALHGKDSPGRVAD